MALELTTSKPRFSFGRAEEVMPLPNLIQMQVDAFQWFQDEGLRELFEEISPDYRFRRARCLSSSSYPRSRSASRSTASTIVASAT